MSGPFDVRPEDHVYGSVDAPVTVLEFGDYECPYCAAAAPVLRRLAEESAGQVRLVFRNFPLADRHPYALTAALAAEAAGATKLSVRSHHHQGIARLGEGLVATGRAVPGDVVEAFERPGEGWLLGILWHTEEEASSRVMRAFCAAATPAEVSA